MPKRNKKFDYSGKKYSNPFFRRKRKKGVLPASSGKLLKSKWTWRSRLIALTFIIISVGLIWFFYFSSIFNIVSMEVSGNNKITADDIKNLAWKQTEENRFFILKQSNLNLFNKDKLAAELNAEYYLEYLSISKKFPGTIIINLKEKEYSAVWYESDKYYYIDNNGNIFSEADPLQIKQQNYPLIENKGNAKIKDNIVKADEGNIGYIIGLFKGLNNYNNFKIDRFILDSDVNTVKVKILNGPEIYFNTRENINKQIAKLLVITGNKLKDNFEDKEYIDLRYGDRVYYR